MASNKKGAYFRESGSKEITELKSALQNKNTVIEALKHIVSSMTLGKDVSSLFPDVLQAMHTDNIEQKKLVYLYLMNYARRSPQLALMSVQQFTKDSTENPDPLIRGLAIRTMGCMRVDNMIAYLGAPLRKALKDEDPYVRKTAAIAVAKLYDMDPELVDEQGFLGMLEDLLTDSNSMVIANAVAALEEITTKAGNAVLTLNTSTVSKLVLALNDCSEWGQVFIFDTLSGYTPANIREAKNLVTRVSSRLKHANSAVVLGAVKVLLHLYDVMNDTDFQKSIVKLLGAPLITLLSSSPEVQYVALRNINLIIRKFPTLLGRDVRMFFRKYNDPVYVKMEKVEIMILLANSRNIDKILSEFKEYCMDEVDVPFVRKTVSAIGRCAIKVESAADTAVKVLLDLIEKKSRANYIVQESIVVMRDIFRKYPLRYEKIISKLFPHLNSIDLPEAKAAMIWIVGEYSDGINNAGKLIQQFAKNFEDEQPFVQLSILTASVKVLLHNSTPENENFLHKLLTSITNKMDNPDLRDRAVMYWRLLAINPQAASSIILAKKPNIEDDTAAIDPALLKQLLADLGKLSSVFHKPSSSFVPKSAKAEDSDSDSSDDEYDGENEEKEEEKPTSTVQPQETSAQTSSPLVPGILSVNQPTQPVSQTQADQTTLPTIVQPAAGHPVKICGQFTFSPQPALKLEFVNSGSVPLTFLQISFNTNFYGIFSQDSVVHKMNPPSVSTNQIGRIIVPLAQSETQKNPQCPPSVFEMAFKTDAGVASLKIAFPLEQFILPSTISPENFISGWTTNEANESKTEFSAAKEYGVDAIQEIMSNHNITFVTQRTNFLYYYFEIVGKFPVYLIFSPTSGSTAIRIALRCSNSTVSQSSFTMFKSLFP